MASSVKINEDLKKRIQEIADDLELSPEDVVNRGLDLLEANIGQLGAYPIPKARRIMKEAAERRKDIEWRQDIRKKLSTSGPSIEEMRISKWGEVIEN